MSQEDTPNGAPEGDPEAGDGSGDEGFYVQDLAFRSGVVPDQVPGAMAVAAALGGCDPPRAREGLAYCDLG
ncbi:hypothetical protein [Thiohalorhabdus sp.]|uniref:hypothetical protein n=1 Tax=Thiohalorhabdus sp. TaxID=3094134 RepID=UPI002FC2C4B0